MSVSKPKIGNSRANIPLEVHLRPWSDGDLPLLERLLGDPLMTEHLGGPESPEKLHERHARYVRLGAVGNDRMFVVLVGPGGSAAGSVGYWEREWQGEQVWETGWSVLPEFQGRGVATLSTSIAMRRLRREGRHRFVHAFPSVANAGSNALCRRVGFVLQGEADFEYPKGHFMRCNDWRLDLPGWSLET